VSWLSKKALATFIPHVIETAAAIWPGSGIAAGRVSCGSKSPGPI
jgi:hypothetical protein